MCVCVCVCVEQISWDRGGAGVSPAAGAHGGHLQQGRAHAVGRGISRTLLGKLPGSPAGQEKGARALLMIFSCTRIFICSFRAAVLKRGVNGFKLINKGTNLHVFRCSRAELWLIRCSDPEIFLSSFSIGDYEVVARVLCGC